MTGAPASAVDPARFRTLMGRWATGVTVVTAREGSVDAGLTVNAFLSVSLDPPSVLVSLMRSVDALPLIERTRRFAVSLLASDQRALSERFGRAVPSEEKFRGVAVHRGSLGPALLDGALGHLECRAVDLTPRYDHVLVVGEVVAAEAAADRAPLLFFRSGYGEADPEGRVTLPPSRP